MVNRLETNMLANGLSSGNPYSFEKLIKVVYERNSWGTAELTLLGREPDVLVNNLASIRSQGSNHLVSPKPDVLCRCKAILHTGHILSRELEDMCSLIKGRKKKKK